MIEYERTDCSGGDCLVVGQHAGTDWYTLHSTAHTRNAIAVTGDELRAFLRQVKCGQFDELVGLEPDTTVTELQDEIDALRAQLAVQV